MTAIATAQAAKIRTVAAADNKVRALRNQLRTLTLSAAATTPALLAKIEATNAALLATEDRKRVLQGF
jgi:hypothetical protein